LAFSPTDSGFLKDEAEGEASGSGTFKVWLIGSMVMIVRLFSSPQRQEEVYVES
jgi:hypothetical protein